MGYSRRFNPYACVPCQTRAAACACCDFGRSVYPQGGDTATFIIRVTGCGGGAPTNQRIISPRTCPPSPLPPGVNYPASTPCCVWPFEVEIGPGCVSDDISWGGSAYVVLYCDGEGYKFDIYCFRVDLSVWVLQAEGVAAPHECIKGCRTFDVAGETVTVCCTWVVDIVFPPLDCCCPDEPPVDCCPCTDGDERIVEISFIPSSGTACSLAGVFSQNSGASGCQFNLDGLGDAGCQVLGGGTITCDGESWNLQALTGDGIDPATETEWGPGMTVTVNSCDPLDIEFNGPQGQVTVVEVP